MPERKHIRLRDFDYSSEGAYFITICIKDKICDFGKIADGKMELSPIGKAAKEFWRKVPEHFKHAELDEFIIMPNHFHAILLLNPVGPSYNGGQKQGHDNVMPLQKTNKFSRPVEGSVSVIIQQYKSMVTKWCKQNGYDHFKWQSKFYDHVIRDGNSYENIKDYIINNVDNWEKDKFYSVGT